ncbi:(2Fe-2S)-binding protein [Methylocaldum marinum]|uniref:(2Fe-2S)-binding protein n=1 Tax=Methylocaldum marinum TaxID=1432792 RepID=UPI000E682B0D|nr:(2Fe-2S)-binding protein [Methylocaldum marinum]
MYICICKAVTESQICEAIRSGACTRKDISACLKAGTACGKCNPEIRNLLRSVRSENGGVTAVRANEAAVYGNRAGGNGSFATGNCQVGFR